MTKNNKSADATDKQDYMCDERREAFENHFMRTRGLKEAPTRVGAGYANGYAQEAWADWRAALASQRESKLMDIPDRIQTKWLREIAEESGFVLNQLDELVVPSPYYNAEPHLRRLLKLLSIRGHEVHGDVLTSIADMLNIGSNVRTPDTILLVLRNTIRRAACLEAVEEEFFMAPIPPDEDGGDVPGMTCILNWGVSPEQYVADFRDAIPLLTKQLQESMKPCGWLAGSGTSNAEDMFYRLKDAQDECERHNAYERTRTDFSPENLRFPEPVFRKPEEGRHERN